MQAPEGKREGELFSAVRHIMQSSPQKLALSQLSGSRDMSMLLAQSAVSARSPCMLSVPHPRAVQTVLCCSHAMGQPIMHPQVTDIRVDSPTQQPVKTPMPHLSLMLLGGHV